MFRIAEIQKNILTLFGIILLAGVLLYLMAPSGIADYTVVGTSYWHETKDRLLLKTAYNYNNIEEIKNFPTTLGDWRGYDFRYSEGVYELLIVDERVETFHVTGNQTHLTFGEMRANRLDIENKKNPDERQVVLYWFMFKRFSDEGVTMIRLSAPVRDNPDATFAVMKGFLEDQLFAAMYESEAEEVTVAERLIEERGIFGIIAMLILLLVPICLIFSEQLKRIATRFK